MRILKGASDFKPEKFFQNFSLYTQPLELHNAENSKFIYHLFIPDC